MNLTQLIHDAKAHNAATVNVWVETPYVGRVFLGNWTVERSTLKSSETGERWASFRERFSKASNLAHNWTSGLYYVPKKYRSQLDVLVSASNRPTMRPERPSYFPQA